ncbi:MAG: iron-sulfur cluster assembly accessory protein [Candidatus Melainabacteria bacterium]|nr:iron-sulfur cluster assembly accessory protein [Candidatus Melainabacteria bacterium]
MSETTLKQEHVITVTPEAAQQVSKLLLEHPQDSGLRVLVKDGGCSGMSYGLDFDNPATDDQISESHGVKIFIDSKSAIYVKGTVIDFEGGLQGKGFTLKNPNAKGSCGCGQSFTV